MVSDSHVKIFSPCVTVEVDLQPLPIISNTSIALSYCYRPIRHTSNEYNDDICSGYDIELMNEQCNLSSHACFKHTFVSHLCCWALNPFHLHRDDVPVADLYEASSHRHLYLLRRAVKGIEHSFRSQALSNTSIVLMLKIINYMKDRRHVAQFCAIRRHKNHDILLSPIPGIGISNWDAAWQSD